MSITALQSNFKLQRPDKNFTEYLVLRKTGYQMSYLLILQNT